MCLWLWVPSPFSLRRPSHALGTSPWASDWYLLLQGAHLDVAAPPPANASKPGLCLGHSFLRQSSVHLLGWPLGEPLLLPRAPSQWTSQAKLQLEIRLNDDAGTATHWKVPIR